MSTIISDTILENISTSIFLGDGCEKENQFVYASQLYGTFFAVYGVFKTSKVTDDKRKIDNIILNIINYKGFVNVGLVKADFDKNNNTIELHVRGMVDPKNHIQVNFQGVNVELERGEEFKLYRHLDRLSAAKADVDKDYVFDGEFYNRDGLTMYPRIRYEQLSESEIKSDFSAQVNKSRITNQGNDITGQLKNYNLMAPGRRCVPATMIARF
jgi:hypothetical protein